jgi:hypothetical protein
MLIDLFLSDLALPVCLSFLLPFFPEAILQPPPVIFWKRPWSALIVHCGLLLLLFTLEIAVFQRPFFALLSVLAIFFFIVLISNAKSQSLREPFIFQDFDYLTDAIKHPRLYLPFLGVGRAIGASVAFIGTITMGMMLEAPLTKRLAIADFAILLIALASAAFALIWCANRRRPAVCLLPDEDLKRLGLLGSLWCYGMEERQLPSLDGIEGGFEKNVRPHQSMRRLPNLVVVQSESFFDARLLFSGVKREVLKNFDALKSGAAYHGALRVPAWGANTVRSEFSFLSGLAPEELGVHRFNPYRRFARSGVTTLSTFLRGQGYHTVCVHPYPASFYDRNVIFPLLGFDEFIDIKSFDEAVGEGPYIDDVTLARKVSELLDARTGESTQPIFMFVITMENHGPLHLEKAMPGDVERLYHTPPSAQCADLTIYLRHLMNADRMLGMLSDTLKSSSAGGWLCFYGDHVPIMSAVYDALGTPDGDTEYVIWHSGNNLDQPTRATLSIENVSAVLLQCMGFQALMQEGDRYAEYTS